MNAQESPGNPASGEGTAPPPDTRRDVPAGDRPPPRSRPGPALPADLRRGLGELCCYRDGPGLRHLAGHGVLLLATGLLVAGTGETPWRWPAMALHGTVLVFLFAPLHECLHRTAFRRRWLNDAVAFACGLVVLLPPAWFRGFHLAHHRFTQDPARDPELAGPPATRGPGLLLRLSGLPYWRDATGVLARLVADRERPAFLGPAERRTARRQALAFVILIACGTLLAPDVLLAYWALPVLLGQPVLRLYLLAEHHDRPLVPDMLENSRTTTSNPAVRFLAWNMPFHCEHHLHPAIPFHALPAAHALLAGRITCLSPGYGAFARGLLATGDEEA